MINLPLKKCLTKMFNRIWQSKCLMMIIFFVKFHPYVESHNPLDRWKQKTKKKEKANPSDRRGGQHEGISLNVKNHTPRKEGIVAEMYPSSYTIFISSPKKSCPVFLVFPKLDMVPKSLTVPEVSKGLKILQNQYPPYMVREFWSTSRTEVFE